MNKIGSASVRSRAPVRFGAGLGSQTRESELNKLGATLRSVPHDTPHPPQDLVNERFCNRIVPRCTVELFGLTDWNVTATLALGWAKVGTNASAKRGGVIEFCDRNVAWPRTGRHNGSGRPRGRARAKRQYVVREAWCWGASAYAGPRRTETPVFRGIRVSTDKGAGAADLRRALQIMRRVSLGEEIAPRLVHDAMACVCSGLDTGPMNSCHAMPVICSRAFAVAFDAPDCPVRIRSTCTRDSATPAICSLRATDSSVSP